MKKTEKNLKQQITSMITVTGDYCAFFPEELSQLEHLIRRQRKEEFPLSLTVMLSLSQRAKEWVKKGEKKKKETDHSPSRWYLNQAGIAQEQR